LYSIPLVDLFKNRKRCENRGSPLSGTDHE
jgi:hypothetical protein